MQELRHIETTIFLLQDIILPKHTSYNFIRLNSFSMWLKFTETVCIYSETHKTLEQRDKKKFSSFLCI